MLSRGFDIPLDVMVLFAHAGGPKLAVTLAQTCRPLKRRLDERYEVPVYVDIRAVLDANQGYRRHFGAVGKYIRLTVCYPTDIPFLPPSASHLKHTKFFHQDDFDGQVEYPVGLKKLYVYNHAHIKLPHGLQELYIYANVPEVENICLPDSLEVLELPYYARYPLPKLPRNLKRLKLPTFWKRPAHILPDSIQELWINPEDMKEGSFPQQLKILHLGKYDVNSKFHLPFGLEELELPNNYFGTSLPLLKFPKSLRSLKVVEPKEEDVLRLMNVERFSHTKKMFVDEEGNNMYEWHFFR